MKAYNMQNNQIIVEDKGEKLFFSYGTLIAKKSKNILYVDAHYWDYSATTLKYFKQFINTDLCKRELNKWLQDHAVFTDLQG